jgi:hypothetical protein
MMVDLARSASTGIPSTRATSKLAGAGFAGEQQRLLRTRCHIHDGVQLGLEIIAFGAVEWIP